MLFFKLLAALPIAVVAAPTGSVDTKAVARSEAGLVLRDTAFVKTERQLVPGGLPNVQIDKIVGAVTDALKNVAGLTTEQVQTIVKIVQDLLSGKALDGNSIKALSSIPKELLTQLPAILEPILKPATASVPLVGSVVDLLLNTLKTLGGAAGGLTGSGLLGRQLPGDLDVGKVVGDLTGQLGGLGLADDVLKSIVGLVEGLLSGKPLDPSLLGKLTALPANLIGKVVVILNGIVSKLPVVGPLLTPLLSTLQLLVALGPSILGGLVGGVTGTNGSAAGGLLGGRDNRINVDNVIGDLTGKLGGLGLGDDLLKTILDLVKGLLSGNPLDTAQLGKLAALPTNLLSQVVGILTKLVGSLPIVGPLLAPLLGVLNLLLALGPSILGSLTGSLGGAAGGAKPIAALA